MPNLTYKLANSAFLTDTTDGAITGALGSQAQVQYFPRILAASGIPVMVANSGTIATAGVVTLGTALPAQYRGCFMYFPASAVVGDSTGGIYYVDMDTSTTVGTVYAGKYGVANGVTTAFSPQIPSTLTAVVGSNSAYTGSTTATNLINVAIPAGAIGNNGVVRVTVNWTTNNSAGAKTGKNFKFYRGGNLVNSIYDNWRKFKKGSGITGDDKWNPADIWMIKKGFKLKTEFDTLTEYNRYVYDEFAYTNMIGISLKKIGPKDSPHSKFFNNGKPLVAQFTGVKLGMNMTDSKDIYIKYKSEGKDGEVQLRNFSSRPVPSS
jgi:hypothetical protein